MGYPGAADEIEILRAAHTTYDRIALDPVATRADILRLQALVGEVFLEDSVLEFVLRIVAATRTEAEFRAGVSVRGGLALKRAAQARALLQGRDFVVPEDVQVLAAPVLAHRLALARPGADAIEERQAVADILRKILAALPPPV
jgi:MoxR-like ATPase